MSTFYAKYPHKVTNDVKIHLIKHPLLKFNAFNMAYNFLSISHKLAAMYELKFIGDAEVFRSLF